MKKIYFLVGSQALYGQEVLDQVALNSKAMAGFYDSLKENPVKIIFKNVLKSEKEVNEAINEVNNNDGIIGVIAWMHTFSPGKMWMKALHRLTKPMCHLHTQIVEKLPFDKIDMDYMNLNQSAHGDREFGFISTRLEMSRKVITGFYKDPQVITELLVWIRAVIGADFSKSLKIIRFGDSMTNVAVTDGDRVEALVKLGWNVETQGVGELVKYIEDVKDEDVEKLYSKYEKEYEIVSPQIQNIKDQARQEIAIEKYMKDNDFAAFSTSFENLHGLKQLPGLAVQRLMGKGYGFGPEGDWKSAGLLATIKTMAKGLPGGSSFMEEYTYNFDKKDPFVLGSHMLEVCPSLARNKVKIDVQPLFIGDKDAPARMIFNNREEKGMIVTLLDLGTRFRMVVNKVNLIERQNMPKLPVAQVLWKPEPSLNVASTCWILAGGGHHSVLTTQLSEEHLRQFASIVGIELVVIDENTTIEKFEEKLFINNTIYNLKTI